MMSVLCLTLLSVVPADVAEMVPAIDRAVVTGSGQSLRDARATLSSRLDDGDVDGLHRYTIAYVDWQLSHQLETREESEEERTQLLEEAVRELTLLLEQEPDNAEAHALLGSVYGEQIGSSAWKGMTLGPKAGASMKKAFGLAPENARVALQRGISYLFTPKMFGGGLERAERELRRAEELFRQQPADEPWPNWGRVEVHIWLGQLLAKKKEYAAARTQYETVLAMEPDYLWVRDILLPALERRAAKER